MKIGLALGSGSARGWAHIGIINALAEQGIVPNIICGTSIGALVGASYAAGNLDKLEHWVCSLTKLKTARFFEINRSLNGFVNSERFHEFLEEYVATDAMLVESCTKSYGAVATDLQSGREIWLNQGPILQAVWASIALPGLFPPIRNDHSWLIDGGLVNPVPVSLCRALGAELVIAVNLNGDIVGRHLQKEKKPLETAKPAENKEPSFVDKLNELVTEHTAPLFGNGKNEEQPPNLFDAIASAVNITQDRITRSRMAGDPPDILLTPKLAHIGLLEFYRANEAINEGKKCVERMLPEIEHVLKAP